LKNKYCEGLMEKVEIKTHKYSEGAYEYRGPGVQGLVADQSLNAEPCYNREGVKLGSTDRQQQVRSL